MDEYYIIGVIEGNGIKNKTLGYILYNHLSRDSIAISKRSLIDKYENGQIRDNLGNFTIIKKTIRGTYYSLKILPKVKVDIDGNIISDGNFYIKSLILKLNSYGLYEILNITINPYKSGMVFTSPTRNTLVSTNVLTDRFVGITTINDINCCKKEKPKTSKEYSSKVGKYLMLLKGTKYEALLDRLYLDNVEYNYKLLRAIEQDTTAPTESRLHLNNNKFRIIDLDNENDKKQFDNPLCELAMQYGISKESSKYKVECMKSDMFIGLCNYITKVSELASEFYEEEYYSRLRKHSMNWVYAFICKDGAIASCEFDYKLHPCQCVEHSLANSELRYNVSDDNEIKIRLLVIVYKRKILYITTYWEVGSLDYDLFRHDSSKALNGETNGIIGGLIKADDRIKTYKSLIFDNEYNQPNVLNGICIPNDKNDNISSILLDAVYRCAVKCNGGSPEIYIPHLQKFIDVEEYSRGDFKVDSTFNLDDEEYDQMVYINSREFTSNNWNAIRVYEREVLHGIPVESINKINTKVLKILDYKERDIKTWVNCGFSEIVYEQVENLDKFYYNKESNIIKVNGKNLYFLYGRREGEGYYLSLKKEGYCKMIKFHLLKKDITEIIERLRKFEHTITDENIIRDRYINRTDRLYKCGEYFTLDLKEYLELSIWLDCITGNFLITEARNDCGNSVNMLNGRPLVILNVFTNFADAYRFLNIYKNAIAGPPHRWRI